MNNVPCVKFDYYRRLVIISSKQKETNNNERKLVTGPFCSQNSGPFRFTFC